MIMPNNLGRQYELHADEYKKKACEILDSGWYILGKEVELFEKEWADYVGAKYCVGLASGLDALWISFRLLNIGKGDEVIVCANAYIACVMGITINGATPVFVEPDQYDNIDADKIEAAISDNTKAILAVHLYGQACDMTKIMSIAKKYNLKVVEDCAQSHGNHWQGQTVGTFGDIGCFSFYPSKGCGAFGDAGCIVTDNSELANQFKIFRNYGSEKRYHNKMVGSNSRLDELQAGLLRVKLSHIDDFNEERNRLAEEYDSKISNPLVIKPQVRPGADSTWHQYVVHVPENRDKLMEYLKEREIGTLIHYPIPPHLSEAYAYLGHKVGDYPIAEKYANEVLSLPMYNGMTSEEQKIVIEAINGFTGD
ncbi:Predicted pyridoxal phosphate-dependent enzyme apparently involved in regulation of cell wall biogenesis [Butyrivibrio fibrisolvens 16/4]|nr:Predicted pyridoxal phosphate-dependent enzyme apparently involved in regulation of cell wall biogenesis [Butyrivibrio fibrisolvens 16/4]